MNNTISLHNIICVSSYPVVPLSWLEGIRLSVGQLGGYGAIEYDSIYSSEDEKNGAFEEVCILPGRPIRWVSFGSLSMRLYKRCYITTIAGPQAEAILKGIDPEYAFQFRDNSIGKV
jgi:hypothetical protein